MRAGHDCSACECPLLCLFFRQLAAYDEGITISSKEVFR
jgi:hypothetical protein